MKYHGIYIVMDVIYMGEKMKVKCKKCGCTVETPTHKWQMNYCGCGAVGVDTNRIVGDEEDYEMVE